MYNILIYCYIEIISQNFNVGLHKIVTDFYIAYSGMNFGNCPIYFSKHVEYT